MQKSRSAVIGTSLSDKQVVVCWGLGRFPGGCIGTEFPALLSARAALMSVGIELIAAKGQLQLYAPGLRLAGAGGGAYTRLGPAGACVVTQPR